MKKILAGILLAAVLGASGARAVQLQVLWSFSAGPGGINPSARLVQGSDGALYGTTQGGGSNSAGTVFKITTNGVFTSLWSFTGGDDGTTPAGGLVQAGDGNLYGVSAQGGVDGLGAIYRISTSGALTSLWSFAGGEGGYYPEAELVKASDGAMYGVVGGGSNNFGMIYRFTTNGVLTPLWSLTGYADGNQPLAGLVQASDGKLYGTARTGNGVNNAGSIFRMTTSGVATGLWAFTLGPDGGRPQVGLVQGGDGALYGTAYDGGTNNLGTLFKITTNGALTPLWSFKGSDGIGGRADAELVLASDGSLYGTATIGGTYFNGTIYKITAGGVVTGVWSFASATNGATPKAALVQASDGALYGTTSTGGTNGYGTIFRLVLDGAQPPTGYDAWAAGITNGVTNYNQSATGDGYANLLKYFTGSSPTNPDNLARLTGMFTTNGSFALQFNRNTNTVDVTAIVEGSFATTNNAPWTGIATNINGTWGSATNVTQVTTGTPAVVTVRDIVPPATNRYLRIRLTRP